MDKLSTLRAGVAAITTPREAVEAMIAAGATFTVRRRDDCLGMSFTYSIAPGGDAERCRAVMAMVKAKPAPYLRAFQVTVQDVAGAQ